MCWFVAASIPSHPYKQPEFPRLCRREARKKIPIKRSIRAPYCFFSLQLRSISFERKSALFSISVWEPGQSMPFPIGNPLDCTFSLSRALPPPFLPSFLSNLGRALDTCLFVVPQQRSSHAASNIERLDVGQCYRPGVGDTST